MKLAAWILGATLTSACGGVDAPAEREGTWTLDQINVNAALLGVWGSSPEDVWVVGGQVDRSYIMHGDGTQWTEVEVNTTSLLQTVYGFTDHDVYAVGENGLILHYDGTSWTQIESGTTEPLYGVWGTSGDDVWIVGGQGSAVALRGSRGAFHQVALGPDAPSVLFKAHGFAADDVVLLGSDGLLRWNGETFNREEVPTTGPLFSAWRGGDDMYAVGGGAGSGELLHSDGDGWTRVAEQPIGEGLSGVFTSADGPTIAVGASAYIGELDRDGTLVRANVPRLEPLISLHGVWGDEHGTTYSVGGDLVNYPRPMSGVLLRRQ